MLFNKNETYPENWQEMAKQVKEDFGWCCACCQVPHASQGEGSILTVHHIDENRNNNSKGNLLALCFACHVKIDEEARQYFDSKNIQPPLFEGYDYLTKIGEMWRNGLQKHQAEQLQEKLRQAMLDIYKKKRKQLKLFDTPEVLQTS